MDARAQEILANYNKDLERWKATNAHHKDIQPLTINDVMLFKALVHPTSKKDSKELTRALVDYFIEKEICTAQDIYDDLGFSDKPILKRIKLLRQFGFLRKEGRSYYYRTPRMMELKNRYLERICR